MEGFGYRALWFQFQDFEFGVQVRSKNAGSCSG